MPRDGAVAVHRIAPTDGRGVGDFVRLEQTLVGDHPLFWSPPQSDLRRQLSGRSAFFGAAEHALFVAEHAGQPVARCAAIVNRRWQSSHRGAGATGFIGYFAAAPNAAAPAAELLARAEDWLSEREVRRVIAPYNGSALTGMAMLTDAFDESPMFPMPWNPRYYRDYVEAAGYVARYPLWVYELDFASERYREASRRMLAAPRCEMRPIDKRRWSRELETLRELFNAGMREEWEMQQFTAAEFKEAFGPMRASLDSRLIQFALDDGRPIGFVVGLPDLVPLFRSFRGRLGPMQVLRLLRSTRVRTRAGAIGGALLPEYRGRHIATMAARFFHELELMGFESALYLPVNDANAASRGLAEAIGAHGRLLYHCFEKEL